MTRPEEMPRFVEWSQSFTPPTSAIHYLSERLTVTDAVLLLNLLTPPLIEVDGCVLREDRYSPENFRDWSDHFDGSVQDIEWIINQVNLWDVFNPTDNADEQALEDIARTIAAIWPDHARRTFPDRTFESALTDSYGPGVTLFQRQRPERKEAQH